MSKVNENSVDAALRSLLTSARDLKEALKEFSGDEPRMDFSFQNEGFGIHFFPAPKTGVVKSSWTFNKETEELVKVEGEEELPTEENPPAKKKRTRRTKAQIAADNARAAEEATKQPPLEEVDLPDMSGAKTEDPAEDEFLSETAGGEDDETLGDLSEQSEGSDELFDAGDDQSLEGLPEDFEGGSEAETEKVAETSGAGGGDSLDDLLEI